VNLKREGGDMNKHLAWSFPLAISAMLAMASAPALAGEDSPFSWGLKLGLNYANLQR
jgi:hypothetical protein